MLSVLQSWYKKYFSHPEAVWLLLFLGFGCGVVFFLGDILAPVIISLIIVYLIEWFVLKLVYLKLPRGVAYFLVYLMFLATLVLMVIVLLLLWKQAISLFRDLPQIIQSVKVVLIKFTEKYPNFFPKEQIDTLSSSILLDIQSWAKHQVSSSLGYISGIITWLVYLFLIPLIVFFLLKDRNLILRWFGKLIPKSMKSLHTIWFEMDKQIGNYLRGKIMQIVIVGMCHGLIFLYFHLNYAVLLAVAVGISVIIPYVGTVLVSIPVVLVGYLQWGVKPEFTYMLIWYSILQMLDGNVLVPVLFSKAVNLHPIAIVIAVLLFGACWGFWGIVFAIPLATFVKTVLLVWPIADKNKLNLIKK